MNKQRAEDSRQTKRFASLEEETFLTLGGAWAALEHSFAEIFKPHGITPTQYNVLRILRRAGNKGLCRAEVMERMIAKVPDATRLLDRMESAGLIERRRDTEDRRFVTTLITDDGLRLLAELDEPVQALHCRHLGILNKKEKRDLIEILGRIKEAV